jgi:toxin ParE1/3/4
MRILLTVDAEKDIEEIYCYSVSNFGESQAELYYSGLSKHFTYIADNPNIGSNFSFIKESVFRSNYESHAVYYRQGKNVILILRILHQHMDPIRHMP